MTLQTSGAISLSQVNVELKLSATATISLNDAAVRKLLGKASGTISMYDAYGKSHEILYTNVAPRTSVSIYELMGSPTEVANYVFVNKSTINASTSAYALRTGVFPAGSTLTIINDGYIYGLGGAGSSNVSYAGMAGGNAIHLDMPCRIDNTNGYIFAGGGGGGSAQRVASTNTANFVRAGGGGGAGSFAGAAGTNAYNLQNAQYSTHSRVDPKAGTTTAGGAGGTESVSTTAYTDTAYGGAGGSNGASGAAGSTANTGNGYSYKDTPSVGVAGSGGAAIFTVGNSLTKIAGFNSTQVKGVIV